MSSESRSELPAWVVPLLRERVASRPDSRDRIMRQIRASEAPVRMAAPIRASRWTRRGLVTPAGALITALASAMLLSVRLSDTSSMLGIDTVVRIVGDTVLPSRQLDASAGLHTALFDTLRIVEFVIRGQQVRSADVVGDFNGWRRGASPMQATANGEWRARLVVPADALRYAIVVNGDQVVRPTPQRSEHPLRADSI